VKLGEVCEIVSGKNQAKVINPNGKYPIYGSSGIFGYADEYLCKEGTTVVGRKGTINSPCL
jgi:type I restriction enzyme, S subunit